MAQIANDIQHVATIHPEIYDFKEKYIYAYGGRGGGKSKTVARVLPLIAWENPETQWLVTRKSGSALEITAKKDTLDAIYQMKIPGQMLESKFHFEFANGSRIYFRPLFIARHRNESLKGMDLNGVWIEEPTECNKSDFDMLDPCVRLPGIHKFFFTFNPPETSQHWIYPLFDRQKSRGVARKIHFALEDNPLLPEDTLAELDALEQVDPGLYKRWRKGEWGIDVRRQRVWSNVHIGILEGTPEIWIVGADFGWSNPSSAHLNGIQDNDVYMVDEVYRTHMQPEEFGDNIIDMIERNDLDVRRVPVIADSAHPDKIKKLRDKGLWVFPSIKGAGSVNAGITEVRRHTIYIDDEKCPNAWREIPDYVYPVDRDGNIMEEPAKINDHSPDDLRMAVHAHYKRLIFEPAQSQPEFAKSHF